MPDEIRGRAPLTAADREKLAEYCRRKDVVISRIGEKYGLAPQTVERAVAGRRLNKATRICIRLILEKNESLPRKPEKPGKTKNGKRDRNIAVEFLEAKKSLTRICKDHGICCERGVQIIGKYGIDGTFPTDELKKRILNYCRKYRVKPSVVKAAEYVGRPETVKTSLKNIVSIHERLFDPPPKNSRRTIPADVQEDIVRRRTEGLEELRNIAAATNCSISQVRTTLKNRGIPSRKASIYRKRVEKLAKNHSIAEIAEMLRISTAYVHKIGKDIKFPGTRMAGDETRRLVAKALELGSSLKRLAELAKLAEIGRNIVYHVRKPNAKIGWSNKKKLDRVLMKEIQRLKEKREDLGIKKTGTDNYPQRHEGRQGEETANCRESRQR